MELLSFPDSPDSSSDADSSSSHTINPSPPESPPQSDPDDEASFHAVINTAPVYHPERLKVALDIADHMNALLAAVAPNIDLAHILADFHLWRFFILPEQSPALPPYISPRLATSLRSCLKVVTPRDVELFARWPAPPSVLHAPARPLSSLLVGDPLVDSSVFSRPSISPDTHLASRNDLSAFFSAKPPAPDPEVPYAQRKYARYKKRLALLDEPLPSTSTSFPPLHPPRSKHVLDNLNTLIRSMALATDRSPFPPTDFAAQRVRKQSSFHWRRSAQNPPIDADFVLDLIRDHPYFSSFYPAVKARLDTILPKCT